MPHAALWVVQRFWARSAASISPFNAARGFLGGAASSSQPILGTRSWFQCRTRLCGWCSTLARRISKPREPVSMPHAALWVVQQLTGLSFDLAYSVSMPHAALWVVQRGTADVLDVPNVVSMPHAALWVVQRRLVTESIPCLRFQCRTRLCGWCSFIGS